MSGFKRRNKDGDGIYACFSLIVQTLTLSTRMLMEGRLVTSQAGRCVIRRELERKENLLYDGSGSIYRFYRFRSVGRVNHHVRFKPRALGGRCFPLFRRSRDPSTTANTTKLDVPLLNSYHTSFASASWLQHLRRDVHPRRRLAHRQPSE
jgi:hypothetical protein